MLGIQIFSKKSRIFRIVAVILPLPFLLLSFLLGAVETRADSAVPYVYIDSIETVTIGYESGDCVYHNVLDSYSISGSSSEIGNGYQYNITDVPKGISGYYEGTINFSVATVTSEYTFESKKSYYGFFNYNLGFSWSMSPSVSNASFSNLIIEDLWCSSGDNENSYLWSTNTSSGNTSRSGTLRVNNYFSPDKVYSSVDRETFIIKFRVYVWASGTSTGNMWGDAKLDLTTVPSGYSSTSINILSSSLRYLERDEYYLYNINENVKGQESAINNASQKNSQDLNKIDDHLMNDNSGFSSGVDSAKSEFESQEAVANQAMDGAVHNYTGQLDTVQDMDFDNFWTNQSNTAIFWRDVGEFILDPSNLGMFAGGLVIVSVMTLFVFMLRL